MLKSIRFLPFAVAATVTWSLPVLAQGAPPPAASDSDDLEVPANPVTVPGAAASKPRPESSPQTAKPAAPPESAKAAASADDSELRRELSELRLRLDEMERSRVAPTPESTPKDQPAGDELLDEASQEPGATSRAVPKGLHIDGFLQGQFESNQVSQDQLAPGGAPLNFDRFTLRRGRLRFDHGWEYANATLELEANTTRGVSVGIRRAEASLLYRGKNGNDLPPLAMLTFGVTDIPFGFELQESARVRPFMERSLGSSALFPTEMDVGMKVSGAVSFLRYAFAVTNGEPVDNLVRYPRDPNAAKDFSGRVGVETRPLPALSVSGGTSFYQGKGFHAGTDATKPSLVWLDANEDRVVQPGELVASAGTASVASMNFNRWAYGLDLELKLRTKFGTTRLLAEGFLASNLDRAYLIADPGLGNNEIREAGGHVALLQDVTRWGQVGFRASYYDPNSDFFNDVRGRQVPTSIAVTTLSPMVALILPGRARLSFQYDFVSDSLAKDSQGVPTDAKNNQLTLRLQVEL